MSRRGVVCGCLLGMASGWNFGNVGAVASDLAAAYAVPLVVIGLFVTALVATHTAIQIPGGRASDRIGPARAGAVALGLVGAGAAVCLIAAEPAVAVAGRAVTGLGTGLAFISGSALVRESGGSPFAQGLFGGLGLGAGGVALAVVPALAGPIGWRAPFWTSLGLAAALLAVVLPLARGPRRGTPVPQGGRPSRVAGLVRDGRLWRIAWLYAATYGMSVVLATWAVELLRRHGTMSATAAAVIGSLTLGLVAVTRPVGGWVLRTRPERTRAMVAWSLVAGAAGTVALLSAHPPWLAALGAVLVGVGAGVSFAPAFTGAAATRPDAPAAAVGLVNTVANVVVLAGTPLLGLTFTDGGGGRAGFAVVAALWLVALAVLPGRAALGVPGARA